MTTQQSGHEAFEALVEKWRDAAKGIKPSGTWNGNDLADRYEWCADELEAALARGSASEVPTERQGREVEVRLWDSQWVNVVNAPEVLNASNAEEAVRTAVRMTERFIAKNVADATLPPAAAPKQQAGRSESE